MSAKVKAAGGLGAASSVSALAWIANPWFGAAFVAALVLAIIVVVMVLRRKPFMEIKRSWDDSSETVRMTLGTEK